MTKNRKKSLAIIACTVVIAILALMGSPLNMFFLDQIGLQQDEFIDRSLHQRFFIFKRNLSFDLKVTPVQNMMLVLQSLDSFHLCEEDWLKEMQFSVAALKEQYQLNKHSLDPGVQDLMELQLVLIQKMDALIKDSDSERIQELQTAFEEYVTFYEEHIIRRGDLNELGGKV